MVHEHGWEGKHDHRGLEHHLGGIARNRVVSGLARNIEGGEDLIEE